MRIRESVTAIMCHATQGEASLLRVTSRDLSLPADRVSQRLLKVSPLA
jgi:hypothetical protein